MMGKGAETRDAIGIVRWGGGEWGRRSHFFEESDWYRVRDFLGKEGWCVGYRDFVKALCRSKRTKSDHGHGGVIYILYDDGSIGGVDPAMTKRI